MARLTFKHLPDVDIQPANCFVNVERAIEKYGGSAVYGWRVVDMRGLLRNSMHHSVWRDPAGTVWEITPVVEVVQGTENYCLHYSDSDFEPDCEAILIGEIGSRKTLPSRFVPLKEIPRLQCAADYLVRSDCAAYDNHPEKQAYYTKKANDILHKFGCHVDEAPCGHYAAYW